MMTDIKVNDLVLKIKHALKNSVDNKLFEDNERMQNDVKIAVENYLNTLAIDFTVPEVRTVHHTWTSLYPNKWARLKAWAYFKLGGPTQFSEQRWFHTIIPFNIEYRTKSFCEWLEYNEILDYDSLLAAIENFEAQSVPIYYAELITPHETVETNIQIKPTAPINHIDLSIVTKEGASFTGTSL